MQLNRRQVLRAGATSGVSAMVGRRLRDRPARPQPAAPIFSLSGGATPNGMLVNSMLATRDVGRYVNLAVSEDIYMRGVTMMGEQMADEDGITRHVVTGRKPDTRYYAQLVSNDSYVGRPLSFKTLPAPNGSSWTRRIAVVSCMSDPSGEVHTELAWQDILDWQTDDMWHLGDWGYWGGQIDGESSYKRDLQKYAKSMRDLRTMARTMESGALNAVTISDHEIAHNGDPDGGIHNSPESIRELIAFQRLFPIRTYGDTRSPRRGRYYSYDLGTAVRVIVTDFRSPDRSNWSDPDGPRKTMFGATQLAWLRSTLDVNRLNIIVHETTWLATPYTGKRAKDKPWSYYDEQQVIAEHIVQGGYKVAWVGGDRHCVGYLAGEQNTLGGFPCYISSGMSKKSLNLQEGELMTWQFGANEEHKGLPVVGYMQLTLSYDSSIRAVDLFGKGRAVLDTTKPRSRWVIEDIPGGTALNRWYI